MKRAAIISKPGKPEMGQVVREVTGWLRQHGYELAMDSVTAGFCEGCQPTERAEMIRQKPDFVMVLGGDGTLLATGHDVARAGIPIVGVNLGSLGFLTEVKQDEIRQALETIDAGRCAVSLRSMLECRLLRNGQTIATYEALNDVVVNQGALARITDFDLRINGQFVSNYKADGLIVATPTGSTAYSLAAGGPILAPDVPAFVITPVASHALTNRPLVVRDTDLIEISMKASREAAFLAVDGQQGMSMADGDILQCRKSELQVKLLKLPERSFFDVLRMKLKWGER
ncbi:MAG: NAD(+)/NADH kinase [Acidobacteriia bacterium]|nr:NAD(+)/NADH kinase [Terriglobia bacterium]